MRLYILEINFIQKISFLHAKSTSEAIARFQRIYTQYAEQVPNHVRELHDNEKVIIDTITGEIHCIGAPNIIKKCLDNLMHLHTPINRVPSVDIQHNIIQEPVSFIINPICLSEGNSQYNGVGIDTWENTLKEFLQIEILSVLELERLLKEKGERRT